MTVDINFGKLGTEKEDDIIYHFVNWPGIYRDWQTGEKIGYEDDGTDEEFTIFSGAPFRSCSNHGFHEWMMESPEAAAVYALCKPRYPGTHDFECRRIDDELLALIDKLPEDDDGINADRARFFKYWSRRAADEFGRDAYISFS